MFTVQHFLHPFSKGNIALKPHQKRKAILIGLVLTPFLIIPGFLAFYGVSYYFKNKQAKILKNCRTVGNTGIKTLNLQASSSLTNIDPSKRVRTSYFESSSGNSTSTLPKSGSSVNHHHGSSTKSSTQTCADSLDLSSSEVSTEELNGKDFLTFLHSTEIDKFNVLFKDALLKKDAGALLEFLSFMDLDELTGQFQDLSDKDNVVLKIENQELNLSKRLLSRFSPFFDTMFNNNFGESNSQEVLIEEVEIKDFKDLLGILFGKSTLILDEENLEKFLYLAGKFQLHDIRKSCQDWITNNFDALNFKSAVNIFTTYDIAPMEAIHKKVENILKYGTRRRTYFRGIRGTCFDEENEELKLLLPFVKKLNLQDRIAPEFYICFPLMDNLQVLDIQIFDKDVLVP